MPIWLQIVIALNGGVVTFIGFFIRPAYRFVRTLVDRLERIEEHFNPESELSRTVGTLPERVATLEQSETE